MAVSLGTVCRATRRRAGVRQLDVGELAGVSHTTISHFEQGRWWVRETEAIVSAYAKACGVSEYALWFQAVDLMRK